MNINDGCPDISFMGTVEAQGNSLTLTGNVWKKIAFNYTITPNTILEFDFESGDQGEVHGIGFDTDDTISSDRSFELYGSHNWGIRDYKTYSGSGAEHYQIPVGDYYTGTVDRLFFVNDHDVSEPTAESRFSNIRVYEAGETGETTTWLVYLHTDHLGAVVKATDESQAVVWDVERKPFGERESLVAQVEMPLGFPGQYFDEETNHYYNYFRDYDPATGRYLQSDPIGLLGGLNTYAYVEANPLSKKDVFGLASDMCDECDTENPDDKKLCSEQCEDVGACADCCTQKHRNICKKKGFFSKECRNSSMRDKTWCNSYCAGGPPIPDVGY
ncbi:MAG: RHS repeat-associated core domain-containing protein [Candidatus Thiodiazotropha sp. L084R]